jgi:hypothetical protein
MRYTEETVKRNNRAAERPTDTDRMRNAAHWAEEIAGWMKGPRNAGLDDYHIEIRAGKPVLVLGSSWTDSKVSALTDALDLDGFPDATVRTTGDETRIFFTPADRRLTGTAYVEGLDFFPAFI